MRKMKWKCHFISIAGKDRCIENILIPSNPFMIGGSLAVVMKSSVFWDVTLLYPRG
jgi:hypothetical protein